MAGWGLGQGPNRRSTEPVMPRLVPVPYIYTYSFTLMIWLTDKPLFSGLNIFVISRPCHFRIFDFVFGYCDSSPDPYTPAALPTFRLAVAIVMLFSYFLLGGDDYWCERERQTDRNRETERLYDQMDEGHMACGVKKYSCWLRWHLGWHNANILQNLKYLDIPLIYSLG